MRYIAVFSLILASLATAEVPLPAVPWSAPYHLTDAPAPSGMLLQQGDRLAICGDSITEQKMYSRIIETYLTACTPGLEVTCRQFGWSGEQAGGFAGRMANDVLRFRPNVATTCYGMNDFRYVPFDEGIAAEYRRNQVAVIRAFKEGGARVLLGSPGIIDSVPHWVKSAAGTKTDLNIALSLFRNIDVEIAQAEGVAFADVYLPMLLANAQAKAQHGPGFRVAGADGVHPGWAGQVVMAYAFLKGLGVDGDLGTLVIDEGAGTARAEGGHEIVSFADRTLTVRSRALPFCAGPGDVTKDDNLRAGMALVPFDDELNRFTLKIVAPKADHYEVTWGETTRTISAKRLAAGINLAKEFEAHPLHGAFTKIWDIVGGKQDYETRQVQMLMHGPEGAVDMEATVALTESVRERMAQGLRSAVQPVEHRITVQPVAR